MQISEAIALADPGYELYGIAIDGRVTGIELVSAAGDIMGFWGVGQVYALSWSGWRL